MRVGIDPARRIGRGAGERLRPEVAEIGGGLAHVDGDGAAARADCAREAAGSCRRVAVAVEDE